MNEFLKKLIEAKTKQADELRNLIKEATTADQVRSLGSDLDAVNAELKEAKEQLANIEKEDEKRSKVNDSGFEPVQAVAVNTVASAKMNTRNKVEEPLEARSTMEYRKAFMDYIQKGVDSDLLERSSSGTTADLTAGVPGVLIPQTVIQEIIQGVEKVYGQLYSRVRKTNVKGGVKYPIGTFENATFNRITEGTLASPSVSSKQASGEITGYVEFSYNIGEIRLARTLLQTVLSVPVFEQEFAKVIVRSYVEAMDKEIMLGDSTDLECEGILTEAAKVSSRIPSSNIIEFTAADMADWKEWQKKLFAKIPLSMRGLSPEFVMTANTYESNIKTLVDDNNRPLYNETFNPVDGREICKFKGKDVVLVEEDILKNFNDADNGEYFGMYWVPEKAYAINSNLEFNVVDYFDHNTNQYIKKAIVVNDGKILDPKYLYLLKKKVEA